MGKRHTLGRRASSYELQHKFNNIQRHEFTREKQWVYCNCNLKKGAKKDISNNTLLYLI